MKAAAPEWLLPPNLLTYARVALTPAVAWAIVHNHGIAALLLVAVAGFSDAFDGFLARRFGWQSALGAYLDPLADKLLLVTLYVAFATIGLVPVWLVSLMFLRDLWILSMVAYAWFATPIRDFPPRWTGKASTAAQLALAGVLLFTVAFPAVLPHGIADLLMLAVTFLACASGVDYTVMAIRRYAAWRRNPGARG
ncbi:MAG: CDP-alcohol phosphatidyltransferase family protein [Bryobacterales bacterium]|nr:CDP-alcohol phosphatidyltransferase family protein [Bryobacterales bacterium]